jgi:2-hydroxychromene-2-carboxylate isomerase
MSPWTYLGHRRFVELIARHGVGVNVKPVDYGRIFPVSGGLPLKQRSPQRQAYRLMELKRWREFLGIPLTLEPKFFPYATDAAVFMIIAADQVGGASKAMELAGAILTACWADEANCADADTLTRLATKIGLDAAALRSREAEARSAYDRYTQEAIDRQVFGAPTYLLDGELFWGQDRLDFLERKLRASAQRRVDTAGGTA